MKTKTINLYEFDELSEKAKSNAVFNLSDLNTSHNWWEYIYEDAARVGIKITGFDIDGGLITGKFLKSSSEVAILITMEHGETCKTYEIAAKHVIDLDNVDREESETEQDAIIEDLGNEFEREILREYLKLLKQEFEHLSSSEQIIETIKANEYTFTESGKLENI